MYSIALDLILSCTWILLKFLHESHLILIESHLLSGDDFDFRIFSKFNSQVYSFFWLSPSVSLSGSVGQILILDLHKIAISLITIAFFFKEKKIKEINPKEHDLKANIGWGFVVKWVSFLAVFLDGTRYVTWMPTIQKKKKVGIFLFL